MQIEQQIIELDTPTGSMRTYLYRPKNAGNYPAVLFYSEIFQQTGPIERSARWLAGQGYWVLVPEVFHELNPAGTVLAYDDRGRDKGNADKAAKPLKDYDGDNRAMIDWLKQQSGWSGKIASMGFCIGGHLAFRAALQPEIRAAVCFYATDLHSDALIAENPADQTLARCASIQAELLMIWGKQDPHIPDAGRMKVYQALLNAGNTFTWHEFNGPHAFMRDEGDRYDPALQQIGFNLTLETLTRCLKH